MDETALIRPPRESDRAQWGALFGEYALSGNIVVDDAHADRVWRWICDPAAQTRCLVAERADRLVGLVHYRELERPILADLTGYIDDLYVAPEGRGQRLGVRLIEEVLAVGAGLGWSVVRWTTKQDNAVGNHLYPSIARLAPVNTYVADVPVRADTPATEVRLDGRPGVPTDQPTA